MDKSIVAAEDTRVGNESLVLPIEINSIYIDLDCAMGEKTQSLTHEHFSILGFTAEMRKKDRKLCLPFAADMNLPPLPVPKFRRWQCSDCLSEMMEKDSESTPEVIVPAKSAAGSSSVHNTAEENDGLQLVQSIDADVRNSEGGNLFPHITTEANQVQTKQITRNNSEDENPSTGSHGPGKASSPSDGDILFSSVPPKRKPKLRSLADIIKEDDNSIPAQQIEPELDHQAQLDAPKKVAAKTLRRRKKIVLEDEEGEERDHLIATSRSIQISESESERDNNRPPLFDSQMSAKTDPTKAWGQRSLDINRKNLHKDPLVAAGASTGDTGPFFNNSLFREQMHGIYDMSNGEMVKEGGYSPYTLPPSNDCNLGVCNNHEKAMDLSLSSYEGKEECSGKHTVIPDLNESIVEKTNMTEEHQLPTLHDNSDMFFSSGKEEDNSNTVKASKDQQERSLANSRTHLGPVGIQNNNPYMFNFYCTNSGGSSGVSSGTVGCLNFPQSKNCDSNMGQFRQFGLPTELHSGPMNLSQVRLNDSADLLRPPRRKNMSFDISQPSGLEDQSCKGKNVKRAATDWSLVSSMDTHSNDTIPAMQFLSLMDQRNVSGSSFKHGRPVNKNGNPNDVFASSSSFFRQSKGANNFPTLLNGARCSGNFSSKNIFSLGQMPPQKGNSKLVDLAATSNLLARAWRSDSVSEVCCTLNRNPADFSAPDARNEFTISAKDLKRRRRNRWVRNDPSRRGRGNN